MIEITLCASERTDSSAYLDYIATNVPRDYFIKFFLHVRIIT